MPLVKLQHIISFTSEDSKHKIENLLNGNGVWLCNSKEQPRSIKAEFQLEKATTIDFIDIGNHNSAMVCIEVGMSSWPTSQNFESLLPTVVLMSPSDCRSDLNSKTVRMFKRENLDKDNVFKKWDRIRVTCSQPFRKNIQYGLAFLKLYSQGEAQKENNQSLNFNEVKERTKSLLSSIASKSSSPVVMSESLQSLESCRGNADDSSSFTSSSSTPKLTSPISRAGRLVMARKLVPNELDGKEQKKALECEALTFLISMNLTNEDIHSLKVSHIREEFEVRRKKSLNTREKLIFKNIALDYATQRIKKLEDEKSMEAVELLSSDSDGETSDSHKTFSFKQFPKSSNMNRKDALSSPSGARRNNLALIDSKVTPNRTKRKRDASDSLKINQSSNKLPRAIQTSNSLPSSTLCSSDEVTFDFDLLSPVKSNSRSFNGPGRSLGSQPKDAFGSCEGKDSKAKSPLDLIECPLCTDFFSNESIEEHAANCVGHVSLAGTNSPKSSMEECPICGTFVETSRLADHAEQCAEETFS